MNISKALLNLINNSQKKTTQELMAQCATFAKEDIIMNYDGVIADYYQLPTEERFYISRDTPLPSCWGNKLQIWKDWSRQDRYIRFERVYPQGPTWAVHFLMRRAGMEHWLRWLDSFPEDEEIASFLMYCSNHGHEISKGLEVSCEKDIYPRIRSLLFYSLVTDLDTDDSELAKIVYNYPEELLRPCVSILEDFAFALNHPHRTATMEAAEYICSNDAAYALLTADEEPDKGCLAAQARFLCRTSASKQRKRQFADKYSRWILRTEKDHPLEDSHGIIAEREVQFLDDTAEILSALDSVELELINLWRKKTVLYYGWESDTETFGNGWFQSIGLILYGIGQHRYMESKDALLLIRVFNAANQFIPEALHDREYAVLLTNLLANVYADVPELNDLQMKLIQKTISLPLQEKLLSQHKESGQTDQRVLEAFEARIALLSKLP